MSQYKAVLLGGPSDGRIEHVDGMAEEIFVCAEISIGKFSKMSDEELNEPVEVHRYVLRIKGSPLTYVYDRKVRGE